jgi:hypothetical protein
VLILTGLPTAFMGHKNRWSSFFLLGFYSFMAATGAIILKFGVLDRKQQQINLPDAKSRGLYLFACGVSGFLGGFISIFFWQMTKYLIGALGGVSFMFRIRPNLLTHRTIVSDPRMLRSRCQHYQSWPLHYGYNAYETPVSFVQLDLGG